MKVSVFTCFAGVVVVVIVVVASVVVVVTVAAVVVVVAVAAASVVVAVVVVVVSCTPSGGVSYTFFDLTEHNIPVLAGLLLSCHNNNQLLLIPEVGINSPIPIYVYFPVSVSPTNTLRKHLVRAKPQTKVSNRRRPENPLRPKCRLTYILLIVGYSGVPRTINSHARKTLSPSRTRNSLDAFHSHADYSLTSLNPKLN